MKNPFRSLRLFAGETASELKKATWPTRSELRDSTLVVIVAIILIGFYVSLADFSLFQVVTLFTHWIRAGF